MTKDIRLYIGEQQVEFKDTPAILYNWAETDFSNPTVTMNGYSANISVEGTAKNNLIFGQYWNLERYTTPGGSYNPTYRVPFSMYVNGEIFETGYVKLQSVTVNGSVTTYEISLFGGLGSFLYNLSTDWNTGEKKSLADLNYYKYPIPGNTYDEELDDPEDLSFTINRNTVQTAWNSRYTYGNKWSHINFAPCYNGLNDHMTNDKAVINFNGINNSYYPRLNGSYQVPNTGYSVATLPGELTEWEMKDLRSWLQRPVIKTSSILDACRRESNNKGRYDDGYKVILDGEWFNGENPYFYDTWMTLPMISEMQFEGDNEEEAYTRGIAATYRMRDDNEIDMVFNLDEPIDKYGVKVKATVRLFINSSTAVEGGGNLYPSAWYVNSSPLQPLQNAYAVEMYASNISASTAAAMATSNVAWCGYRSTGKYPVEPPNYNEMVSAGRYIPKGTPNVNFVDGYFAPVSGNTYQFNQAIELECQLPVGATCFRINVQRVCNRDDSLKNKLTNVTGNISIPRNLYSPVYSGEVLRNRNFSIDYTDTSNFFSGREVTKERLLSTDYSPADWLMAYCKMFGLYIWKEPGENIVHIDSRKTFYRRDNIINLQDAIDYSKDLKITPVAVDSGFYSMNYETEESGAYKDYKTKYGKDYGIKIIDTGYEFDANTKELIDIPIKGGIQVRGNSQYYFKPIVSGSTLTQPFSFNGVSYPLYRNGTFNNDDVKTQNVQQQDIPLFCEPIDSAYTYYDAFDKPQFCDTKNEPVDGANVFLFDLNNEDVSGLGYYLTDDLDIMATLNNNPCWLITSSTGSTAGTDIATALSSIPHFSRYYTPGDQRKIQFAFDWGSPRQLYVPELYYADENTLYGQFYRTYLEDLYDVNTKVLSCYIKADKVLKQDDLRNFYWFQNGLWRLNKIESYNPTNSDTVKVEFVKVQDVENMTSIIPYRQPYFVSVVAEPQNVPASGGVVTVTIITNDGMGCAVEDYSEGLIVTPSQLHSDGIITVTVPANTGSTSRDLNVLFTAGDAGSATADFTQAGGGSSFQVSPSTLSQFASAGTPTRTISVTSTVPWSITSKPAWITATPASGSGNAFISVSAGTNTSIERSGSIVVSGTGMGSSAVTVSQASGQTYQPVYVNFNPTGTIKPGDWGWSGWTLERVTISEHRNFEDGTSDYLYQYEPGLWLEYGDADYNYMTDGAFTMETPSEWKGQNKTFYIFLEANNSLTGQYIRGTVTAAISSNSDTNINLPSADNTWFGPWSS